MKVTTFIQTDTWKRTVLFFIVAMLFGYFTLRTLKLVETVPAKAKELPKCPSKP